MMQLSVTNMHDIVGQSTGYFLVLRGFGGYGMNPADTTILCLGTGTKHLLSQQDPYLLATDPQAPKKNYMGGYCWSIYVIIDYRPPPVLNGYTPHCHADPVYMHDFREMLGSV